MQIGFVSAILPELPLDEVLGFAQSEGFACVEPMCWPTGRSDRRYAGVTHLDVSEWTPAKAAEVRKSVEKHGVPLSALGYYPNPLDPDASVRTAAFEQLLKMIAAASDLGLKTVNTFIGRDPQATVDANFKAVKELWSPIVEAAHRAGVRIAIEHCPMLFSEDEWPGGKNLPVSPALWHRLFEMFPEGVGLNFDPSHLVYQMIDIPRAVREFGPKIFHVHAKDERIIWDRLYQVGIMGLGWHEPKLPGLGDVAWGPFFAALTDAGYDGPVCIEVEDRAYEKTTEDRKRALRQSLRFLKQYVG